MVETFSPVSVPDAFSLDLGFNKWHLDQIFCDVSLMYRVTEDMILDSVGMHNIVQYVSAWNLFSKTIVVAF